MNELAKNKESSSAMASFVEGVLLIDLIESEKPFMLNLKDGLKWSISPEWIDDKRRKYSVPVSKITLIDRNSSLTSSITRGKYKRGDPVEITK
jgi:hypothetical protein